MKNQVENESPLDEFESTLVLNVCAVAPYVRFHILVTCMFG